MPSSRSRRLTALLASGTLLVTLVVTIAAPAAAAGKATCQGHVATIVGTDKGEKILGTSGADVIAGLGGNDVINGRGGNDIICGGPGRDRLVGATGRDRLDGNGGPDTLDGGAQADILSGGAGNDLIHGRTGNDRLSGGPGTDTCYQEAGTGPRTSCELPAPPSGPSLISLNGILAVAFSDIDGRDGYSTGDVLIAKLMDTSGDGQPGSGDSIVMGRYPLDIDAGAFGDWLDHNHAVASASAGPAIVTVTSTNGHTFTWTRTAGSWEAYQETSSKSSYFQDGLGLATDTLVAQAASPSAPQTPVSTTPVGRGPDDRFVDIVLHY